METQPPVPGPPKEEQPPMPELPPNNTIYLNNLTEKVKIPALIIELRAIFNQFGNILEIQVIFGQPDLFCTFLIRRKRT